MTGVETTEGNPWLGKTVYFLLSWGLFWGRRQVKGPWEIVTSEGCPKAASGPCFWTDGLQRSKLQPFEGNSFQPTTQAHFSLAQL